MRFQSLLATDLDSIIDGSLRRERLAGCVVLISIDGDLVYHRAAGMADVEAGRDLAEDAIFRYASMTKPIVSAAALILADIGVLDLEAPITRWLPDFRPRLSDGTEPDITLRHLLTHTSGLDYGFDFTRPAYRKAGVSNGLDQPGLTLGPAMERLAAMPLLFEPGTNWTYSLATDIVGAVIEGATAKPLPEVVQERICGPLGMTDTAFRVCDAARLAKPYKDGMPRPLPIEDGDDVPLKMGFIRFAPSRIFDERSYPSGGAGMAGTAGDFLCFLEAIRTGGEPILSHRAFDWFTRSALPAGVHIGEQGWGHSLAAPVLLRRELARTHHNNGTLQGGGAYGHDWFVDPGHKLSVVLCTNTAFEGCEGAFPISIRDAVYHALTA